MEAVEYVTYNIEYNDHGLYKCINIVGRSFDEVLKSFEKFSRKRGYEIININLRASGYMYV